MSSPVTIIMIEDDEGHARLIERNIRRSAVNNEILPFTDGTSAVNYLFGKDGTGSAHKGQALLILQPGSRKSAAPTISPVRLPPRWKPTVGARSNFMRNS